MAKAAHVTIKHSGEAGRETNHGPVYRTVVHELRTLHEATLGTTDSRWASFGERSYKNHEIAEEQK